MPADLPESFYTYHQERRETCVDSNARNLRPNGGILLLDCINWAEVEDWQELRGQQLHAPHSCLSNRPDTFQSERCLICLRFIAAMQRKTGWQKACQLAAAGHCICLFSTLAPQQPGPADCTESYSWISVAMIWAPTHLTASPTYRYKRVWSGKGCQSHP